RRYPERWPLPAPTQQMEIARRRRALNLISAFAGREPVAYLHPAFGFVFERFADEPQGFSHRLVSRPAQESTTPILSESAAATGDRLWTDRWGTLERFAALVKAMNQPPPQWRRALGRMLRLGPRPSPEMGLLGSSYAKALDDWGVQMQRLGRGPGAAIWFE